MFLIQQLTRLPYAFPRGIKENKRRSVLSGLPSSQAHGSVGCQPRSPGVCREGHSALPVCSEALWGGGPARHARSEPGAGQVQARPGHCVAFCLQRKWPSKWPAPPCFWKFPLRLFVKSCVGHPTPKAETTGQRTDTDHRKIKQADSCRTRLSASNDKRDICCGFERDVSCHVKRRTSWWFTSCF